MWNYRILEHTYDGVKDGERFYSLVEVYYTDGKPWAYTAPINFGYMEAPEDIRNSLSMAIRDAMKRPVLRQEDVHENHPWDRNAAKDELREEILREEGLWDDDDDPEEGSIPGSDVHVGHYEVDNWEPPTISVAQALAALTKERKEAEKAISKTGISDPENRDSGNGEPRVCP